MLNAAVRIKLTEAAALLGICSAESQWLEIAEKRIDDLLLGRAQMRGNRPATAKELLQESGAFLDMAVAVLPRNQMVRRNF